MTTLCYHCSSAPAWGSGVLCLSCWLEDRSLAWEYGPRPLPAESTLALPGSAAKVEVLEERADRGLALWHPGDPVIEDGTTVPLLMRVLSESYFRKRVLPRRQPRVHTCSMSRHHQDDAA